ncbi:MAG: hypothetical protein ACRD4W_11350, partial [Nitrososphaeraceae archaeon]
MGDIEQCGTIRLGIGENIPTHDIQSWTRPRFGELERMADAVDKLFNGAAQEALDTGDPESI